MYIHICILYEYTWIIVHTHTHTHTYIDRAPEKVATCLMKLISLSVRMGRLHADLLNYRSANIIMRQVYTRVSFSMSLYVSLSLYLSLSL